MATRVPIDSEDGKRLAPRSGATAKVSRARTVFHRIRMPEVLVHFDEPHQALDGRLFAAQVYGSRTSSGIWEGWIEFHPHDGGEPAVTGRETEQLTRGDLRYWAAGLTPTYLASALVRALAPDRLAVPAGLRVPSPPRAADDEQMVLETTRLGADEPMLDPGELLKSRGEHALRQELRELDGAQLRDIIVAYDIPDGDVTDLARTFEDALVERIVACMQQRVVDTPATKQQAVLDSSK